MSTALRRARLEAELAELRRMLDVLGDGDLFERVGLEGRHDELAEELHALATTAAPKHAEADLTFYGDPVIGTEGIDAVFASQILQTYQDLVAKVHATRVSSLRSSGPVRDRDRAQLHITGTIQGSFGFQLRELAGALDAPQTELFQAETSLFAAVEESARLIDAAGKDDEAFVDALQEMPARVAEAIGRFLSTVHDAGARFRLATATMDAEFDFDRIEAAVERSTMLVEAETDERFAGIFGGVLRESRAFEHRVLEQALTIRGKLTDELDPEGLVRWYSQHCVAIVRVRRWSRGGRVFRRYTLLDLAPIGDLASQTST